jgi:hypothetical protein
MKLRQGFGEAHPSRSAPALFGVNVQGFLRPDQIFDLVA